VSRSVPFDVCAERLAEKILIEQGAEFFKGSGKHRFVLFAGDNKRIRRLLRKALKWDVLSYRKRDAT
jgi:hypothetical protein